MAGDKDPLSILTAPPPNETPEEKARRERKEAEAQRVSDKIDDEIKAERAALKKQKGVVKVLLLGQSESGKSTTLKNFRMKYAKEAWLEERASWKAVIQLNLIRSIITIVETLQAEMDNEPIHQATGVASAQGIADSDFNDTDTIDSLEPPIPVRLTEKHQLLKLRLGPLRNVEADLKRRLGAATEEIIGKDGQTGVLDLEPSAEAGSQTSGMSVGRPREFGVRGWRQAFGNLHKNGRQGKEHEAQDSGSDESTEVIASCREDMKALWADEAVHAVLTKRRMRIQDSAGFFLEDLDRIATRTYEPSDDDVMRARLRTLGVQEYKISFDSGGVLGSVGLNPDFGREWIIYDVGGSRTLRHAWLPYFDTVNAIIFLAPISCFDERLLEDSSVNRLEDSFLLWRAICASKLLAKTTMILFLNKCDILKRKLKSGVQVKQFLPSYGDRPNDTAVVVKYLREKFKDTLRQHSPEPRVSYFYATSVTDTKATATTLKTVRDSILREHLKNADFV